MFIYAAIIKQYPFILIICFMFGIITLYDTHLFRFVKYNLIL